MSSTGEGFGITFLEAIACGTPAPGLDVGRRGRCIGCWCSEPPFRTNTISPLPSRGCSQCRSPTQSLCRIPYTPDFGRPAFRVQLGIALGRLVERSFAI